MTTSTDSGYEQQIFIRQCSEPTAQVSKIYTALEDKHKPFPAENLYSPRRKSEILKAVLCQSYFRINCNVD